jgi:hypothetical protein
VLIVYANVKRNVSHCIRHEECAVQASEIESETCAAQIDDEEMKDSVLAVCFNKIE